MLDAILIISCTSSHLIFTSTHFILFYYYFFYAKVNYYLFIFVCVESSFLCEGFLQLRQAGPLFIAVRGPLTIAASLVVEYRLQTRRLSSCGSWA